MNRLLAGVLGAMAAVLSACAGSSGPRNDDDQSGYVTRGLSPASSGETRATSAGTSTTASGDSSRPVIAIDGLTLAASSVWPSVAEAAGPAIADELVLGHLLARECETAGIRIGESDLEAERRLVMESMTGVANTPDPDRALDRIRRERGLGPERWKNLLRRNAMLRALVRERVVVSDEAVERAYQLRYGPTYRARLIVTGSPQSAGEASRRAKAGEDFGALAAATSTDPSAARGGVIDGINPADSTWPLAIRQAVQGMTPGSVSDPIVVDGGYAVLRLESMDGGGAGPGMASVRTEMERVARIEAERLAMQTLADQLRSAARVEILDASLRWSR
jgi:hypothetical protein